MKKFIYTILFILYSIFGFTQNTFNTLVYNVDSLSSTCYRVLETNDNAFILSCATNINTDFTVNNKTRLIKLDYKGNILWDKIYAETPSSEFSDKVVNAFDGGYLMASSSYSYPTDDEDTIQDILVRKLDYQGNVEWYKAYPSRIFTDLITTSDSSYLLLANVHEQKYYFSSDIIVYKIDTKGDVIWKNRYGLKNNDYPSYWESPKNIYEFDENYYINGLWHRSDSSIFANSFIYKIDNLGKEQWKLNYPYKDISTPIHILAIYKLKNNLYFNTYENDTVFRINDINGSYQYENISLRIRYTLGAILNRNYDISCNEITTINLNGRFWVFKKYKELEKPYYTKTINKVYENQYSSRVIDFQKTKDGGYIYLRGGIQTAYLVTKTDCLGNDSFWSPDCDPKLKQEYDIILYPNPTNNILNIETSYNITNIEIINTIGQTINYKNYCNCNKQTINIEHLPIGNYFIKVNGSVEQSLSKFIKK